MRKDGFISILIIIIAVSVIGIVYQGIYKRSEERVSNQNETSSKGLGYINAVYSKDNRNYLTIDYIQMRSNQDGGCSLDNEPNKPECNPNGYYIDNDNTIIKTFEISKDVKIYMQSYGSGNGYIEFDEEITFDTFKNIFNPNSNSSVKMGKDGPPFHIEINNNKITKITEQYLP